MTLSIDWRIELNWIEWKKSLWTYGNTNTHKKKKIVNRTHDSAWFWLHIFFDIIYKKISNCIFRKNDGQLPIFFREMKERVLSGMKDCSWILDLGPDLGFDSGFWFYYCHMMFSWTKGWSYGSILSALLFFLMIFFVG